MPFFTFSADASTPPIFTALTVSFNAPRDVYPIAYSFPATCVIITDVLFVILASAVVISTFSPSFSSSTPKSSTNAPLVPEPSSLDTTEIFPASSHPEAPSLFPPSAASLSLLPHPVSTLPAKTPANSNTVNFFIIYDLLF